MPEGSHSATHDVPMGEESPRLSTASVGSNERSSTATLSDCGEPGSAGQRPVSLVSTLSSGSSGSSRDDSPPCGGAPPDVDLDLCPPELTPAQQQCNNNNAVAAAENTEAGGGGPPLSPFAAKAMAPNPKLTYLDRVVMEIIETERMYVRDLRSIVEDYLAQIIDISDLPIRPEQVCALFGNIEDIYEFNSDLLQSLEMCDNDAVAIARCFVLKREYFEIYTQYCTNYPNSVAALTDCMRNKTLAKFFRERQAALKRSLPLGSYLLKPVQRILKYHLLLQEIAKHFDPQEEGYEVVEEAIYTMTGVAWYINDMKRKHEHAVRLQEVQSLLINWKGPDLTTYGELVLEGTFKVHRAKNERTLFLFDRMLLITKRRGEHYVYKTHISCSTLMLIESAKDSLCFSVTHYKHPKQPHTVQARTVEERKLWAHHIKRLILENHQAIIPQKAKEAILEMDSMYSKYRYSPDRMKKATSYHSEDFPNGRQGRRQSEPTKQILKSTKAILKHADSEGALPASMRLMRPVQPAASISTLGSSIGESEAERPSMEDEEEDEEEEEEEEEEEDSLERLSPSDSEEPASSSSSRATSRKPGGLSRGEALEHEDVFEEGSDPDEIVMEDNQVADFASSMLEAISCWHTRARALLSLGGTTDEEEESKRENGQTTGQEETQQTTKESSTPEQAPETILQTENSNSHSDVSEKPEQDPPIPPVSPLKSPKLPDGNQIPHNTPKHKSLTGDTPEMVPRQEESSGHSSEEDVGVDEEEDEEEEEDQAAENESSILPPSVLGQASAIAEHFVSSTRRSSSTMDEVRSLGCPSPRIPSRTGSTLSLGGGDNTQELTHWMNNHCSEDPTASVSHDTGADVIMFSPREDNVFDGSFRRRDSTLSKKDQLLIDKIKGYYENVDYLDAGFCIKRRESLTYIPTGLVRSSVTKLNSIPKDDAAERKSSVSSCATAPDLSQTLCTERRERIVSSTSFDALDFGKRRVSEDGSEASLDSFRDRSRCQSLRDVGMPDDEFRPSSEMIKVWQEMEKEVTKTQDEPRGAPRRREAHRLRVASPSMSPSRKALALRTAPESDSAEPLMILEESDLSTITEESSSPSPPKGRGMVLGHSSSLSNCLRPPPSEGRVLRAPVPRVIQLRAEAEIEVPKGELEQNDADATQNSKVFHLARKYSQRIKCTKPMVLQRSQETEGTLGKRNLLCVLEERPEKEGGKPNLTLSLDLDSCGSVNHQDMSSRAQLGSPSPIPTPTSLGSPRVLSPSRTASKSPLSPTPVEGFNWPDVRELRSKYTHLDKVAGSLLQPPVARSYSVPEKMQDCRPRRRSSCSIHLVPSEAAASRSFPSQDPEGALGRQHRTGSLDQRLSHLHFNTLQDFQSKPPCSSSSGYYVSGETPLPNDKKLIVVEKVNITLEPVVVGKVYTETVAMASPPPQAARELQWSRAKEDTDDSYVQIRSPTSREKISIMAVIDRCRAYQESEEYRLREESAAKAEQQANKSSKGKDGDKLVPSSDKLDEALKTAIDSGRKADMSQQNVVKNLRERFLNLR
ncbi:pleckstrin homology domain-containing family G member 3-like isoform X2 [Alosa pseudoharengus]|uniref:pleckstrin homology domain-containing family G member 3-like isoform X2 n=1 Tax=Alosa pseudoharengus TaxID=34774 RepID=UPI003F8AD31B